MYKYGIYKLGSEIQEERLVKHEDVLTSDIFGLFYYLPYEIGLLPFLKQVKKFNSFFPVPSREPANFEFWPHLSWPQQFLGNKDKYFIEPDVLIEWSNLVLMVEAKVGYHTLPDDIAEELYYEYRIGNHYYPTKSFYLLLIDGNLVKPPTENLDKHFQPKDKEELLWTNWGTAFRVIEDIKEGHKGKHEQKALEKTVYKLTEDLIQVLEKKGLKPFEQPIERIVCNPVYEEWFLDFVKQCSDPVSILSHLEVNAELLKNYKREFLDPVFPIAQLEVDYNIMLKFTFK